MKIRARLMRSIHGATRGVARVARAALGRRRPSAVDVNRTITIDAPAQDVYRLLSSFEDYARFMPSVERVEPAGERRWRWRVAGPSERSLVWEVRLIRVVPNELIAWTTVEGAAVESTGSLRLERIGPRGEATRVSIRMTYRPPPRVGPEGESLPRAEPRQQLDAGMRRVKSMLERSARVPVQMHHATP